jgi:hypothetical protein
MGDQLIAGTQGYFLLCRTSWSEVRQETDVAMGFDWTERGNPTGGHGIEGGMERRQHLRIR